MEHRRNEKISTEDVFTAIYDQNKWGGEKGEFCSGTGTRNKNISSEYISMIFEKAESEQFRGASFVDLGCGDFYIGGHYLRLCVAASRLITTKHQRHSRLIDGPDYMPEFYER